MTHQIKTMIVVAILTVGLGLTMPTQVAEAAPELKEGDVGGYVWDLQHRLQQLGHYQEPLDGKFGPHNKEAVYRFQHQQGLVVDGVTGFRTWQALRQVTFTVEEIEMLAKLVYGEARGETFEGQVAVAAVAINRLHDDRFPNNMRGVIFEPRAFTAVDDGQYYQAPDKEAYRAVYYAIRGWDPSEGALFYFNPDVATSSWIWSRDQIKTIGKHIFAV
ncbi:cell wall hydrolase [Caldalkalibacillus salinus]|uniref:cell wall hydrolase n=1 Tax=Caldalkalibacillus salinus TaxID=2803787 RepID=UPI001F4282B8|nr:cell wall hydrolase [Caldalkalibacillus salinus]